MILANSLSIIIIMVCTLGCVYGAPYVKPSKLPDIPSSYVDPSIECCTEDDPYFVPIHTNTDSPSENGLDNLLYIPFTEMIIRDFGIHKYVVNRNIKTLMNYHTDSHLVNIIFKSLNQSASEITRLVMENRAEFDLMSQNKFISDFLDFWCAYRLIQLSEFSANNLDILANMIFKSTPTTDKNEF